MGAYDAVIEIPRGSRVKYEVDHGTGRVFLDRVLFTPIGYPANYRIIQEKVRQQGLEQVFFGATVSFCDLDTEEEQTWQIVGVDEADAAHGRISWISPLARAVLKAKVGDVVRFQSPAGMREIEVVDVRYL